MTDAPGMKRAPGISTLTPEQSVATEKLFGHRYVAIQQKPVLGRAERRRAQKKRGRR